MDFMRAIWVVFSVVVPGIAFAEPAVSDLAARMELRAVETLTLSDQQFLLGDKNGKAATLAGVLRIPRGPTGRVPAIILQHGSGGVGPREEYWARFFNEFGIATFLVDSFSGRGIVQTSTDQAQLGRLNMILDGYRSFDVLANHTRVDPERIAIMGFSRGGQSTLYSAMNRFRNMWNPRANFAAYIPLYASCDMTFIEDTDLAAAPIRQFHGQADDWVSVAACKPYYERLRAAGRDVKLARDETLAKGIVINGLVILSDRPVPWNAEHTNPPGGLEKYYQDNVVGGPGAFVLVAENFNSFGRAIIKKLIAEIALLSSGPRVILR